MELFNYLYLSSQGFSDPVRKNINRWNDMQRIFKSVIMFSLFFASYNASAQEYRSIDGYNNNLNNPEIGTSHSVLAYWTSLDYADNISTPKMGEAYGKPNPRLISNSLFAQSDNIPDTKSLSDYTWVFGQFVDHDITLIESSPFEVLDNIVIPDDDQFFTPGDILPMLRNQAAEGSGTSINNPRKHINQITAFIDGSAIYGSDEERAEWLRGENGMLKVSSGDLLPWNTTDGDFNSKIDQNAPPMEGSLRKFFVAGDVRANENPMLIGCHTLFVREHNRLAQELSTQNPSWDSDKIYQEARKINVAQFQSIVYNEWLPAMGVKIPSYTGYKSGVDPAISNVFSAAAFRLGHTLINSTILRIDNQGNEILKGNISLKDAFFNPNIIALGGGIEPYFKGMGIQTQQKLDCKVVDDVRNFLFATPGTPGMDLAAININRGRERGLGDFNTIRQDLGLPRIPSIDQLTDNPEEIEKIAAIYGGVNNIDAWVGMLAEKKSQNTIFGETMLKIVERQFQVIRDGDRFYYENDPSISAEKVQAISSTTFYDVLMRNTYLEIMQPNLFTSMDHSNIPNGPELEALDLEAAVYPNPVRENLRVKIFSKDSKEIDMFLLNYAGQQLIKRKINLIPGDNFVDLHMDDNACPRGFYNLQLVFGGKFTVLKVIKER